MARRLRVEEINYSRWRTYHVTTKCVRSLRLLGENDGARKDLVLQILGLLSDATCIEVAGYALMDNHLHLVLRAEPEEAEGWSATEVARRWTLLHPERNGYNKPIEATEKHLRSKAGDRKWIKATRGKLSSISQYMKETKQRLAEHANREDGQKGAFWGSRFNVEAIENDRQLLTTMAYVDLNPFAANLCQVPEDGRYTSLEARMVEIQPASGAQRPRRSKGSGRSGRSGSSGRTGRPSSRPSTTARLAQRWLIPISERSVERRRPLLPGLSLRHYLNVLDHMARLLRPGKRNLRGDAEPILKRMGLSPVELRDCVATMQERWRQLVGSPSVTDGNE